MDENAEEWLATEDPTNGDLPATDFMGSTKDQSQTVDPEEGDGTGIEEIVDAEVEIDHEVTIGEDPGVDAHVEGDITIDVDNGGAE